MKRAAIYCRVSSAEQASADHVSLQVQDARCRSYVDQRGWSLVAIETDAESGLKATRAGYQRVIALARAQAIDVVVVYQASRFGRKASEVLVRTDELRTLGVELVSTAEDLSSFLMLGIQAILNEEESRRLSARVAPAKRLKASQGFWLGHAPFGTVNVKGVLQEGPHFDLVRLAFELAAAGVASREINRRLNAALAPRVLHLSTVRKMLRNPAYGGRVVWDDVDAPAKWEPLIPMELFNHAGEQLRTRYLQRAVVSPSYPFWIVGLAFCGCGARMHPSVSVKSWGTRYAYLVCGHQNRAAVTRGCGARPVHIEDVQDWLVAQLAEPFDTFDAERYLAGLADRQGEQDRERMRRVEALRAEKERLLARLQTAKGAHLDAPETFTIADVRQVERAIRDNVAAIDGELAVPAASSIDIDAVGRFLTERAWLEQRGADPAAFRAFLQRFIDRVDVRGRGDYAVAWRAAMAGLIHTSA